MDEQHKPVPLSLPDRQAADQRAYEAYMQYRPSSIQAAAALGTSPRELLAGMARHLRRRQAADEAAAQRKAVFFGQVAAYAPQTISGQLVQQAIDAVQWVRREAGAARYDDGQYDAASNAASVIEQLLEAIGHPMPSAEEAMNEVVPPERCPACQVDEHDTCPMTPGCPCCDNTRSLDGLVEVPRHNDDGGTWCVYSNRARTADGTCPQFCKEADDLAGFDAGRDLDDDDLDDEYVRKLMGQNGAGS